MGGSLSRGFYPPVGRRDRSLTPTTVRIPLCRCHWTAVRSGSVILDRNRIPLNPRPWNPRPPTPPRSMPPRHIGPRLRSFFPSIPRVSSACRAVRLL